MSEHHSRPFAHLLVAFGYDALAWLQARGNLNSVAHGRSGGDIGTMGALLLVDGPHEAAAVAALLHARYGH